MKINKNYEETQFRSLGTDIEIKIVADDDKLQEVRKILEKIKTFYSKKEKIFSRFDPVSELSQLNKNEGKYMEASCDIIEVAQKALEYYEKTGGFFDPRIIGILESVGYDRDFKKIDVRDATVAVRPLKTKLADDLKIEKDKILFDCRMDFSGIAKGYITDEAANFLKSRGFSDFLVDSGGDIYASGKDQGSDEWLISIEGMEEKKLSFKISNQGVATSGITRRKWEVGGQKFHHLINPKNPKEFLFDLKTVTVISENTEDADVWAKTLFLMGKEKGLEYSNKNGIASAFLDYKGNVFLSERIKYYIAKTSS